MEHSSIELNDLPDEIFLIILKKLHNIEVLYSLVGVNKRLNRIINDSIFTSCLTLMPPSSNDILYQFTNTILDRFCVQILPSIHHKIKCLNLESSSMKRILLSTDYPYLNALGLYNLFFFFFWRQGFYFKERKAGQKQTKHEETHDICLMSLLTKGVDG